MQVRRQPKAAAPRRGEKAVETATPAAAPRGPGACPGKVARSTARTRRPARCELSRYDASSRAAGRRWRAAPVWNRTRALPPDDRRDRSRARRAARRASQSPDRAVGCRNETSATRGASLTAMTTQIASARERSHVRLLRTRGRRIGRRQPTSGRRNDA